MLDLVSPLDFVVIVAICGSRELPNYEIEKFQTCGEQGKFLVFVIRTRFVKILFYIYDKDY